MYIPWLGYFEQMQYSDVFVFLNDVQYTKQDWRNRNRIPMATGPVWLTVPLHRPSLNTPINEVQVNYSQDWVRKHQQTMTQTYGKAEYFTAFAPCLFNCLDKRPTLLCDLTVSTIRWAANALGISTPTLLASELGIATKMDRQERLIKICQLLEANTFYEGASGRDYIEVEKFAAAGIKVEFQQYDHPVYPQRQETFVSHMSVVDALFNVGEKAAAFIQKDRKDR